jgi:hypothetical protein
MVVRIGMGRNSMARSVIMLSGADERYMVTISVHCAELGIGVLNTAFTGVHCQTLSIVKAKPPAFTTKSVAMVAHLKTWLLFESVK